MPTPNETDQERLEKIKQHEIDRGRDEQRAEEVAREQVEELRKQEGPAGGGRHATNDRE